MKLSPGQDGDGPHGRELLAEFQPGQIQHVLADTAYDGDETRERIRQLKAKACIKPHQNRTAKKRYNKERYKHRHPPRTKESVSPPQPVPDGVSGSTPEEGSDNNSDYMCSYAYYFLGEIQVPCYGRQQR